MSNLALMREMADDSVLIGDWAYDGRALGLGNTC